MRGELKEASTPLPMSSITGSGTVFSAALSGSRGCREEIKARRKCYDRWGKGINTEECYEEELNEKRCLSFHLCPIEAKRFYRIPGKGSEGKGECSLWAECFAFKAGDDTKSATAHMQTRDQISIDEEKTKRCRKQLMDLSICLSHYSEMLQKIENREGIKRDTKRV